ncbi:SIR2 family protein [Aquibacillus sediminis]|uniref:SIR2 family protein n=1 Tax=Aquibacillus sediminis TaxID=2574734 RepID=UPI0011089561|nr:SIR2 family protein [Aquibacillus sediminis]
MITITKIYPYYISSNQNNIKPTQGERISSDINVYSKDLLYIFDDPHDEEDIQMLEKDFEEALTKITNRIKPFLLSKNINLFIGSGCSIDAIPLMGKTFLNAKEKIENVEYLGEYALESNKNIEACLNWLNAGLEFLNEDDTKYELYKKLYLDLLTELKKSIIYTSKDKENLAIETYAKLFNLLFSVRKEDNHQPLNVFTTNYDLLIERTFESISAHYINGFTGVVNRLFDPSVFRLRYVDDENRYREKWDPVSRFARLYKLHGSINWFFNGEYISEHIGNETEFNGGETVIYPTINKHNQSLQTPYSELFRELSINLQKPNTTMIILGYGFPDEHINQLIQQALSNETFNLIIFGDITEEGLDKFHNQNKNKNNLHIIGGDTMEGLKIHYLSYLVNNIL